MSQNIIETDAFVVLLLAFVYMNSKIEVKRNTPTKILSRVMLSVMTMAVTDVAYALLAGNPAPKAVIFSNISMVIYYVASGFGGFYWTYYAAAELLPKSKPNKLQYLLFRMPMVILIIMSILSPYTKWIFDIDDSGFYVRGAFHFVQVLIAYGYIMSGAIIAFRQYMREILPVRKHLCRDLCTYTALPVIGGLVQALNYGTNTMVPAIAIAIVLLYMDTIKQKLSRDTLTGLNNRGQFDAYISAKFETGANVNLHLIFLDIDNFKQINDTYGHIEGDAALICVAGVLHEMTGSAKAFVARYGGDEFVVLMEADESEVISSIKRVNTALANIDEDKPYKLSLSAGYARYGDKEIRTADDLIASADMDMYINKTARKSREAAKVKNQTDV